MTFEQFAAARQLLAEEAVGARLRASQQAQEDRWQASVKALRRVK